MRIMLMMTIMTGEVEGGTPLKECSASTHTSKHSPREGRQRGTDKESRGEREITLLLSR
jgi:hypothetical protein